MIAIEVKLMFCFSPEATKGINLLILLLPECLYENEISEIVEGDERIQHCLVEVVALPQIVANGRLAEALAIVQKFRYICKQQTLVKKKSST